VVHVRHRLARVRAPIARFLAIEASGGILLVAATGAALLWANSPVQDTYERVWAWRQLGHWVNDGLMALFFFVVGLEIKRELVAGHLADRRAATLPAIAALGGMAVPALLYAAFNAGGAGSAGWGIPMATDIAFALGVLALLGDRVPQSLQVLLLALAIVDDVGAIAVIAVFYSDGVDGRWLAAAGAGLVVVWLLRRWLAVAVAVGIAVWLCTYESGVHATLAGVAVALVLPVSPRLEDLLHPWTSYVVVPVFALANAGVVLSSDLLGDAATSPITLGVLVGLVVGKVVGVAGATALAVRAGLGRLPAGVGPRQVLGGGAVAGIGFTVSIFIAGLAFDDPAQTDEAKVGILVASVLAALLGAGILRARTTTAVAGG
jgi:Na+:H+ antiporter, NhaA family